MSFVYSTSRYWRLSAVFFVAAVTTGGFSMCTGQEQPTPEQAKTAQAKTTESTTQQAITSIGNAQLTAVENVKVATRDAGIVQQVLIKEGDRVQADQLIFALDTALYEAEANARRVETRIADTESRNRVDLLYAEKSSAVNQQLLTRSQDAYKQYAKSITRTEIDRLELELEKSNLSADQARHEIMVNELGFELSKEKLEIASLKLGYREIQTPIFGTVAEVLAKKGEWVAEGQTIARIINPQKLRVEVLVNQRYVFQIRVGQRAVFENSFGGLSAEGKIVFVSPEVNPFNETIRVWAEIDNTEATLRPGFKGTLTVFQDNASSPSDSAHPE